jgi:hypothetical protein
MRRTAIIALVGSVLAACSTTAPVSKTPPTFAHKYVPPKAWIDPPQVGAAPGVPSPAGLD